VRKSAKKVKSVELKVSSNRCKVDVTGENTGNTLKSANILKAQSEISKIKINTLKLRKPIKLYNKFVLKIY
jgi:hypothetical protein